MIDCSLLRSSYLLATNHFANMEVIVLTNIVVSVETKALIFEQNPVAD